MDVNILRNLSYGVYVVSTPNGAKSTGCIANSLMQITHDTIAVSINHKNYTNDFNSSSERLRHFPGFNAPSFNVPIDIRFSLITFKPTCSHIFLI